MVDGWALASQWEAVDGWALADHAMGDGGWVGTGRPMGGRGLVGKPMGLMGGQANLQFTIFADSNFSFKYYVP